MENKIVDGLYFEVIEDNGGGLHLAVFRGGEVVFFHCGYEYCKGLLMENIRDLVGGSHPVDDGWDGNSSNPASDYNSLVSYEYGWQVVVNGDASGIVYYPGRMGAAARTEFDITD